MPTFREQLRRHSVALISLAVALTSLAYNTWRNEQTEANRNIRTAGVELLLKLSDLDQVVFFSYYEMDTEDRGNPRVGWALVLTIRDLGRLTAEPAIDSSEELVDVWGEHWRPLAESVAGADRSNSADAISEAIERVRADVSTVLSELD